VTQLAETGPNAVVAPSHARQEAAEGDQSRSADWAEHPIDIRLSVPFLSRRYYLTVVAGKERRRPERLVSERARHPLDLRANIVVVLTVSCIIGLALFGLQMTLGLWTFERLLVSL
jgi:hypothetical protein